MPLSFETKTLTVGELFSGSNVFRMPIFQRPYSWDEQTALELYDDIYQASERSSGYFLGPLIVARSGGNKPFDVVDGQQRLVTLSVIFAILRDLASASDLQQELQEVLWRPQRAARQLNDSPRVRLRDFDQDSMQQWVQVLGSTLGLPDEGGNESTRRLLSAIKAIQAEIGSVRNSFVSKLATFILTKCKFVRITAQSLDEAYILFRSFNSRGMPLNELDIIRAELVGSTEYDPKLAEEIAECWDHIQLEIGHEGFLVYVRTIASMFYANAHKEELGTIIRRILRNQETGRKFKEFLVRFVAAYSALEDADTDFGESSQPINRIVHYLRNLPFDYWRTPALLWLAREPTANDTLEFFNRLESLALVLLITGKRKPQIASRFRAIAADVLRTDVLGEVSNLTLTNTEKAQVRSLLGAPIPKRRKFLMHLLLRMNCELLHEDLTPHFSSDATLEHVLPQKPASDSEWMIHFPDAGERKKYCELMGNYALLTASVNGKANNPTFRPSGAKFSRWRMWECFRSPRIWSHSRAGQSVTLNAGMATCSKCWSRCCNFHCAKVGPEERDGFAPSRSSIFRQPLP
jgi:hypothetical protein